MVDQNIDPDDENFGILALPNMETRFVAANSLKKLPGSTGNQYVIRDERIDRLESELKQLRHELFLARTPETKERKRSRHLQIQEEMGTLLLNDGYPSTMAEAITNWKAFNPNRSADWFDPHWMLGTDHFDIVLGNPPYIQLQKALPGSDDKKYADLYVDEGYETFARTGDIYQLFYERGLQLLRHNGWLVYITSNKWMRAAYGQRLRAYLAGHGPSLLLDMGPGVFDAATVDTNILLVQKGTSGTTLMGHTLQNSEELQQLDTLELCPMPELSGESWTILSPAEQALKAKIEARGTPLKDWDVNIYRGVLTGYNEAFIVDGPTKDRLIAEDPKSAELLKPLLRGRDIKRYRAEFADKWLINTHNDFINENGSITRAVDLSLYPAIRNHLSQYHNRLVKRADQGRTPYNLRNCAYLKEFEREKIVWKRIGSVIRFSLSNKEEFCLDSTVILTGNYTKYLVGILNSQLIIQLLKANSPKTGTGDVIISVQALNPLLVYKPSEKERGLIEALVDKILEHIKNTEVVERTQIMLDLATYILYDLSWAEVLLIDPEPPFSQAGYEHLLANGLTEQGLKDALV